MRCPLLLLLSAVLLPATALLADDTPAAPAATITTPVADPQTIPETPATAQTRALIAGYAGMASRALADGDVPLAERFYNQLLTVDAPDVEKKGALTDMFECYRTRYFYSKAIAVGERIRATFPNDPAAPSMLLELGQLYRDTGAYQLAIARFYNVLNAALRIDQDQFVKYKGFSTKAQFEIAETFMISGDYPQAARMYALLDRLDLTADERAHAQFQLAYCSFLTADYAAAVTEARRFLEAYGATEYSPQCHYVLSVALQALHRPQESADEALTLLRMEKKIEKTDADTWTYWQRKTGNQLANEFYLESDFLRALTVYQAMAKLSDDPEWQWPVVYQVGLCFERLRFPDRAVEAYRFILDESKKRQAAGKAATEDLGELCRMAEWRRQHLEWQQSTDGQLNALLGAKAPADEPPTAETP